MGFETIALAAMMAGTAVQAYGQARAGKQAKKAAGMEAAEIERRGAEEARIFRIRGRTVAGEQRAGFAKAGVRTTEGSPLEVLMETADELERGLEQIRLGSTAQAEVARFRGREAARAGTIGAFGTILGGGTSFLLKGRELERTSRSGFTFGR